MCELTNLLHDVNVQHPLLQHQQRFLFEMVFQVYDKCKEGQKNEAELQRGGFTREKMCHLVWWCIQISVCACT